MRNGCLGLLVALLLGTGPVAAQPAAPPTPAPATGGVGPWTPVAAVPEIVHEGMPEADCGPDCGPDCCFEDEDDWEECDDDHCHVWFRGDWLNWWIRNSPLPVPLVTTGPAAGGGVLGSPGTTVLVGNGNLDYGPFSGGRLTFGLSDETDHWGLEVSGLLLENRLAPVWVASSGTGTPLLARPLINAATGQEFALPIATPGQLAGSLGVLSSLEMYGGEANLLGSLFRCCHFRSDMLAGFRYLHLREDLQLHQRSTVLPGAQGQFRGMTINPPATFGGVDRFNTRNDFYGGQLGLQSEFRCRGAFLQVLGKCGLGTTQSVTTIGGQAALIRTGVAPTQAIPSGVLALASNRGVTTRNEFAVLPELGVTVGYEFRRCVRVYAGYTLLYWDQVARPGDQIDRTVDVRLLPTSTPFPAQSSLHRPQPLDRDTALWVQGLHVGLGFRY